MRGQKSQKMDYIIYGQIFLHILALILALKQLLNECGIGTENTENSVVGQHRALVFCQLKAMMDIVERDLLKSSMSNVTYLR